MEGGSQKARRVRTVSRTSLGVRDRRGRNKGSRLKDKAESPELVEGGKGICAYFNPSPLTFTLLLEPPSVWNLPRCQRPQGEEQRFKAKAEGPELVEGDKAGSPELVEGGKAICAYFNLSPHRRAQGL